MTNFECSTNDHITWIHVINRRHCYRRPTSDGPKDQSALYLWAAMNLTEQCIQNNGPTQGYFEYSISLSLLELNKTPALILSSSILVTRNSPTLWLGLLFCVLEKNLQTPNTNKKLAKLLSKLPKRVPHNCETNFALPGTMQFNSGTVSAIPSGTRVTTVTN